MVAASTQVWFELADGTCRWRQTASEVLVIATKVWGKCRGCRAGITTSRERQTCLQQRPSLQVVHRVLLGKQAEVPPVLANNSGASLNVRRCPLGPRPSSCPLASKHATWCVACHLWSCNIKLPSHRHPPPPRRPACRLAPCIHAPRSWRMSGAEHAPRSMRPSTLRLPGGCAPRHWGGAPARRARTRCGALRQRVAVQWRARRGERAVHNSVHNSGRH